MMFITYWSVAEYLEYGTLSIEVAAADPAPH